MLQLQKYISQFLICFLLPAVALPQSIHGKVIAEETNRPLPGASIYINGTTIGTSAANDGSFVLPLSSVINGDVIVTHVGYEVVQFKIKAAADTNKLFVCKLQEKAQALHNVLIMSETARDRWLRVFKENFLGITEAGRNAIIENIDQIYFTVEQDSNYMYVRSDTALRILNPVLGYRINFDLKNFAFNKKTGGTYFYGYTRYDDLDTAKTFTKKRKAVYLGSTLHFYRSLINDQLAAEGYQVFELNHHAKSDFYGHEPKDPRALSDSSVARILARDSISGNYLLHSNYYIRVIYRHETATKKYLKRKGIIYGVTPKGFTSTLQLLEPFVSIDKNGTLLDPLSVNYTGYWIYEKAADLFPFNYKPE